MKQPGCCECDRPPTTNRVRQIWTGRPWHTFPRPFDVTQFDETLSPVLDAEDEIIGYTGTVGPRTYDPWDDPETTNITWEGTRYLMERSYETFLGTVEGYEIDVEYWSYGMVDPNTGAFLSDTVGTYPTSGSHPVMADPGPMLSYVETLTETVHTKIIEWTNYTHTQIRTLLEAVTWGNQVARAEAHVEFATAAVAEMDQAGLSAPADITGQVMGNEFTGPGFIRIPGVMKWSYPGQSVTANPEYTTTAAANIYLTPMSGELTADTEGYTFTEWEPDDDHLVDTVGSGQLGVVGIVFRGIARVPATGATYDYGTEDEAAVPAYAGGNSFGPIVMFSCVELAEKYGCDFNGVDSSGAGFDMPDEDQPVWKWTDRECAGDVVEPGFYFIDASGGPFGVPDAEFFQIYWRQFICCPP